MSKNERKKAGLHKEISSIFKGVVIPQKDGGKKSSNVSKPDHTDYVVSQLTATESQKNEDVKPFQITQSLSNAEPVQESRAEPVEEPKVELIEEPKVEPVQESKDESVEEPKFESIEELNTEPVDEPKIEPVQELKNEPTHAPKFITAHESKVVPVQESEIESFKDSKAEPAHAPKFVTAQESKVIPVEESDEAEPAKESETEPAQKQESESSQQSKSEKTKKLKVIPVKQSKKTDFGNISKKVSKKRSVVKVSSASSWKQITSKLFTAKPGASGTKQKAMVVIVPVLFIVLVIFVFRGGVFGTSVHNAQASEENNNSAVVPAGLDNQIDWEIPEPYPTTLRDPMQLGPVVTGTNQTETNELVKLIVKGILCSEDNSSALIGNSIVHEGDQIQGANVIKIDKNGVKFEMNGKKWTQKVQR
jgi:hypothetical protein